LVQRQVDPEEEEEDPIQAQRASGGTSAATPSLEANINTMKGGGRLLDPASHAFFEPRFGYDFSQVRVHTDAAAAQAADNIGAKAFTTGRNIVFGSKVDNPEAGVHRQLLAHELAHVIQQDKGVLSQLAETDLKRSRITKPLSESLSAAPIGRVQAVPTVTGINVGTELGVGRSIGAAAIVAPGTPRRTALTWSFAGAAPVGVTITPSGRRGATIRVGAAAVPGTAFQIRCALTTPPGGVPDDFTTPNITVVGVISLTFTANPPFANQPIAGGGTAAFPPNTADPNRDGYVGNTAQATVGTTPGGTPTARPVTITLRRGGAARGATATGNVITPGQITGNITVRATDDATGTRLDQPLIVNPAPRYLNAFPGPQVVRTIAGILYGVRNPMGWRRSDSTANPLNRVVGETITAGGRDDLGTSLVTNVAAGGPNPVPIPALAVPANVWSDNTTTSVSRVPPGPLPGVPPGRDVMDVNNYVGPGVAASLPRISIARQGFHHQSWTGQWSEEFDAGIKRRTLRRDSSQPPVFGFRTEHIFPRATAAPFNENYTGPPLINLTNVTVTPIAPAAPGLADDGVATANVTVNTNVPGRNANWSVINGPIAFTTPALGAAAPVGAPAVIQSGRVPGRYRIQVNDSVFPNRRERAVVRIRRVRLRRMRPVLPNVPPGTLSTDVNVIADPGGRILNWTVDPAAAADGVTVNDPITAAAGGIAAPARTGTVTRPAGFTGTVTVTARDSILPARSRSTTIRFR